MIVSNNDQDIKIAPAVKSDLFGPFFKVAKYLLTRMVMIFITIFTGTFITVVLANQGGQIDDVVRNEVSMEMDRQNPGWRWSLNQATPAKRAYLEQSQRNLEEAAGLKLPYWSRQIIWTIKAMRLDWQAPVNVASPPGSDYPSHRVVDIILTDMPHTLLLVGTSFLLLFLIGIPLALYLYRMQGSRLDRLIALLAPISSIPSWVLGVLLILIFAVELQILPVAGMYDTVSPETIWERIFMVTKHMVLPVLAILISLLFQCVYTWRSFFLLYADEDYVELARAKGLPNRTIERQYILRPTLPYILTSFTLMLIGFWQMTIALEKIFNWPGIGRLYIVTLPNFFGDRFYPGIMPITLGIVVLFAYLLGITVLILDISYALVDPQVRIGDEGLTVRDSAAKAYRRFRLWPIQKVRQPLPYEQIQFPGFVPPASGKSRMNFTNRMRDLRKSLDSLKPIVREIVRSPSAVFGLIVILLLVSGSLYAVIAFPYNQLGNLWYVKTLTGKTTVPKLAQPEWTNWFRRDKLPPSIIIDSLDTKVSKTIRTGLNGINNVTITYTISYPYSAFPQNIIIYFHPKYAVKQPFALLIWTTPDGQEFEVGRTGAPTGQYYGISENLNTQRILSKNDRWRTWFVGYGNYPTPSINLLFADPTLDHPKVLQGTYTLRIDGVTFEQGADLDAEFVLLGQVYGVAGTDNMRRDLIVPLLWGMPFALLFGLLGACVTTILSMTLAAMAAWYGGWIDDLTQRLVEANMILPVIAIGVLIYSYFNMSIWTFLAIVVILNVFASPTKSFRAAFLQMKNAPYIEAAKAYGASDGRIILRYFVPRILPMLIPQLVTLIPSYVFLEATLGIFNVKSDYPTWGRIIYEALRYGSQYGSSFWVLEPMSLLLLTGLAFAMLGFALERILNPRMGGKF
jgi:peptide/nickel transport system permease protein